MKITLKILLALVVLLALAVVAVAVFISPVTKNYIEKHDHELLGRSIRMETLKINIFTGRLRMTDLKIGGVDDSTTFFQLDSFDMRLRLLPLLSNRVDVRYITFAEPDVKIYQKGTEFNFDGLLDRFQSDTTQVEQAPSDPWEIGIYNIAIRRGHIFYQDLLLNATWGLNDMDLTIPGVYFSGEKTDVGAVLNFAEGGSLATKVAYDIEKEAFDIDLKLENLALANTLPYFQQMLNVTGIGGHLWADVRISGDVEHLLSVRTKGTAALRGFSMLDTHARPVVAIDTLGMNLAEGDLGKMKFRFDRLYVGGFSTFFELTPQGNNFADLMKPSAPEAAVKATSGPSASPAPTLHISDFEIARSSVRYTDQTLEKPFEYLVSDIRMRSKDLDPAARNNLVIDARMQKTGAAKLRWEGSLDDINNQNITLWLTNLDLKDFTPFCEHYTAYPLTNGNLTFRSQNVIRNRYLDGTNHLDVFEPQVDKKRKELKPELNIPLKLGLFVLKDKKGHVKMDLPVKGSLDSPEFSYRKIVLKAIGNVLLKVVTAPFSFLSGHKDNLEYIDIDPAQYAFSSEQYASFDKIAEMLRDKPEMHIVLTQRLNMERALPLQAANALRLAYADFRRSTDSTSAAGTGMSMLEYEKIQQTDIRTPEIIAFADSLLALRGIEGQSLSPDKKALALYQAQAATQLARMSASRDKALSAYMQSTHNVASPAFRIQQTDSASASGYAGKHRYTLALEVDGEVVSPADSTAAPSVPAASDAWKDTGGGLSEGMEAATTLTPNAEVRDTAPKQ